MIEKKDIHAYDDIIHLQHPTSNRHPRMALSDRAAQFSPFAALAGHDAAVREAARLTDSKMEFDEDAKARLNDKLLIISENLSADPEVTITYFQPDERKAGGAYLAFTGTVKKIDEYEHAIVMMDKTAIPIEAIIEIESDLFERMDL